VKQAEQRLEFELIFDLMTYFVLLMGNFSDP
jgi:hypothetical protein